MSITPDTAQKISEVTRLQRSADALQEAVIKQNTFLQKLESVQKELQTEREKVRTLETAFKESESARARLTAEHKNASSKVASLTAVVDELQRRFGKNHEQQHTKRSPASPGFWQMPAAKKPTEAADSSHPSPTFSKRKEFA